ncbi:hypothetical protein D3C71_78840 [compost metagenome]
MNYDAAGRPWPGEHNDLYYGYRRRDRKGRTLFYCATQNGSRVTIRGYPLVESGTAVVPSEAVKKGEIWIGWNHDVWRDYSLSTDGTPRLVVIHNRFRDQRYPVFHVDLNDVQTLVGSLRIHTNSHMWHSLYDIENP